jgi:nicotinamidase-related amidase
VDSTALLVVDVQEGFRSHIHDFDAMVAAICLMIDGAQELGLPIIASEQYPQGLGHTVPEIQERLENAHRFEKLEISSAAAPPWEALPVSVRERDAFVVVGIETHVCVNQTTHDLLHMGARVHVPADAVSSRDPWQRDIALERLSKVGATVTTVEAALFDLLECAGTDRFKSVQRLIKQHDAWVRDHSPAVASLGAGV